MKRLNKDFLAQGLMSALLLGLSVLAQAQEDEWGLKFDPELKGLKPTYIGLVLRVVGEVKLKRGQSEGMEKVLPESKFKVEDKIMVGQKSFLKIKMIDDTLLDLGPNTVFELKNFHYKTKKDRASVFELVKGKMRTLVQQPANPGDLEIKAGYVAMGIRGTEILANVTDLNESVNSKDGTLTDILLLSGQVEIVRSERNLNKNDNQGHTLRPYLLNPGTLFQSDRWVKDQEGDGQFAALNEQEMKKYSGEGADRYYDMLPFLEVNRLPKNGSTGAVKNIIESQDQDQGQGQLKVQDLDKNDKGDGISPPKKTWREILQEGAERKGRGHQEIAGGSRSLKESEAVVKCRLTKECLEYSYHTVNGRKTTSCTKKKLIKSPPGCKE